MGSGCQQSCFLPEKLTGLVRDNNRQTYDDYALRILGNASNGTFPPVNLEGRNFREWRWHIRRRKTNV